MDLKINQEYIVSCFLYNFIENWFLKGCASINTPFIEIAFRLQSMFIFIITSIYETIQAPAPTTCIHKLVKWFVKLKKTTLNFRTSNFSFRKTTFTILTAYKHVDPSDRCYWRAWYTCNVYAFFKYHTGTFPLLWYILLKMIYL